MLYMSQDLRLEFLILSQAYHQQRLEVMALLPSLQRPALTSYCLPSNLQ
jgi:hypothetical protein